MDKKILLCVLTLILSGGLPQLGAAQDVEPLKILQITGGGPWHDYATQNVQISDGLKARLANVEITTDYEGADTVTMESTNFFFSRHLQEDWAADFDVVIYNHCNLQVKDADYVKGIVAAHVKHQVPAVMLHCPIHLYQYAEEDAPAVWWDFVGAESYAHEKQNHPNTSPYTIEVLEPEHPIMTNYPPTWRTPSGELYLIVDMHDNATVLSHAYSVETDAYTETAWAHEYEGVRVFTSSLGHHNAAMGSDVNLNLIAAGVLWAAGKLQDDGSPAPGYEGERGLGWISLLGDNLNGWIESGGVTDWSAGAWYRGGLVWPTMDDSTAGESFRLEDGTLVVEGDARNLFYDGVVAGGYFRNFEFKVDVMTHPGSASGVYIHTRYEEDGEPAHGYQVQINASRDGEGMTGTVVGASAVTDASHGDEEWFNLHIKVVGDKVTVKVNGETVNEYTEPSAIGGPRSLGHGTIGLEAVGGDSRVEFRNPMIRLLPR